MLRTLIVVSALIAAVAAVPAPATSPKIAPFGIVEGIRDCGSAGELGTVEVTDCTRVPCHFIPQTIYDVALRFRASVTSGNLSLHVYRTQDATLLLEVPIDGVIEAGVLYELLFKLPITSEFANQAFDIRFYVLDLETRLNEVCAEAAVTIGSG